MFNILVIVALSAFVAARSGSSLLIDWRPVSRDVIYYTSSIIMLTVFFLDGKVEWWESLIMVLGYGSYIVFMIFNEKIMESCAGSPKYQVMPELADEVRRVVVMGHPTLARAVTGLIRRPDVEVVAIGRAGQDNVRGTGVTSVRSGRIQVIEAEPDRAWIDRWIAAGRALAAERDAERAPDSQLPRAAYARAELAEGRIAISRRDLVTAVWDRTWPHDRLVVAASRLIRELDSYAGPKAVTARANRGLAGIDGTVSTASGVAIAHERSGAGGLTRLLIGDLALLHDAGGLLVPPGEERPRLQIIVGNDRGGSLFELLEVAGSADPDDFSRVQRTPHDVDLEHLAAAYGWRFERVVDRAGLRRALSQSEPGIIEAVLEGETDAQGL